MCAQKQKKINQYQILKTDKLRYITIIIIIFGTGLKTTWKQLHVAIPGLISGLTIAGLISHHIL